MSKDVQQPHAGELTGHDPDHPANKTLRWRRSFWDYLQERRQRLLALFSLSTIVLGALLYLIVSPGYGRMVWALSIAFALIPLSYSVARSLLRGDVGVDAIALVAMGGSLILGEYLAGAVIALMLSGGNALEALAVRRARRALTSLLERAPKVAHRRRGEELEEVPVGELAVGDVVTVRAGEVVPVDGILVTGLAVVDESTLTGEPLPVSYGEGGLLRSGSTNSGEAFDLRATRPAAESAYAQVVRLVRSAEEQRAPFVRLADRYAIFFLPVTAAIAGAAWALSGDPVRALAVFVVATPCPLILAAPIALISGISRAARSGIVLKGATAIEKLGTARTVLLDKTGTLTLGTPEIERIVSFDGLESDELLRLAASLDQLSAHVLAEALVGSARKRGLSLQFPRQVDEKPGQGIEGRVGNRTVAVGSPAWLRERGIRTAGVEKLLEDEPSGRAKVIVGVDGRAAGAIVMGDHLREDAPELVERLHAAGVKRVAMVTGDQQNVAEEIARQLGVDNIYADQSPEDKLEVVRETRSHPEWQPVVMVGDGVNDAPALALADVGVAMGSAGATVSSETADAVITVDRIGRVADAVLVGRRSFGIARQSVVAGMGLSIVAMVFAAFGYISPLAGALLQEAIDVAVILNALRALRA
jgi:heavy metal translocating P-type ATPase